MATKVAKGVEWDKNISIESPLLSLKISTSSNKVYYLKYTSDSENKCINLEGLLQVYFHLRK